MTPVSMRSVLLLACACALAVMPARSNEDVAVCGGFVKLAPELLGALTNDDMDFSTVRVKVFSSSGFLKHETECAPNGYFFVPLYDRDTYTVRVQTTDGWAFAPAEQTIAPGDDDINFAITGFRLTARVAGAQGVTVTLKGARGEVSATSSDNGDVVFDNVAPGAYTATASHPRWTMDSEPRTVTVGGGNAEIAEPFKVLGYDVQGRVVSGDSGAAGVAVFLFTEGGATAACDAVSADLTAPESPTGAAPACAAVSGADGSYTFQGVPAGTHAVVPRFQGGEVELSPASRTVSVEGSAAVEAFTVLGSRLSGRVLRFRGDNVGVAGATVTLVDEATGSARDTTSDAAGHYSFDRLQTASYSLSAAKEHMVFAPSKGVQVDASSSRLPDVVAYKYDVCGHVKLADLPADRRVGDLLPRQVRLTSLGAKASPPQSITTDAEGKYCFQVVPGKYAVTPVVSDAERAGGLVLTPSPQEVEVEALQGARLDVDFEPAQVSVSGQVSCLGAKCPSGISVSLEPVTGPRTQSRAKWVGSDKNGLRKFKIKGVWPGRYRVTVESDDDSMCWGFDDQHRPSSSKQSRAQEITVGDADVTGVTFTQSGFVLSVVSDLEQDVQATSGDTTLNLHVAAGTTRMCVTQPGVYSITADKCFKFKEPKSSFSFDTSAPKPVQMHASKYRVGGMITLSADDAAAAPDASQLAVQVALTVDGRKKKPRRVTVTPHGDRAFMYSTFVPVGAAVTATPVSAGADDAALMFYPASVKATVTAKRCPDTLPIINARPALFLEGNVSPALEGVSITVEKVANSGTLPEGADDSVGASASAVTGATGAYRVGPLHQGLAYQLAASKPGYFFEAASNDGVVPVGSSGVDFVHRRLGQVTVSARDEAGEPVPGVVLSLSRERYRHNNSTNTDGDFTFVSLFPGSYFVRPILKEYTFSPLSATVEVEEGGSHTAAFVAKRVAFSCFGSVKSLNSAPEVGIVVTAVAEGAPMEETTTDDEGNYRLRGLKPGATYVVSVHDRDTEASSQALERALPQSVTVTMAQEDRKGVGFVVFRSAAKSSVTGTVSTDAQWADDMTVSIARAATPSTAFKSAKLGVSRFFEFAGLAPGDYVITASSKAVTEHWEVVPTPTKVSVTADSPRSHVPLTFEVKPRSSVEEVPTGSYFFLLAVLVSLAGYSQRSWLVPVLTGQRQEPIVEEEGGGWGDQGALAARGPSSSSTKRRKKSGRRRR